MPSRRSADDDREEFERAMQDVARLPSDPRGRVRTVPLITEPAPVQPAATDTDPVGGDYVAPGVDRRELRKLRRGDYTVRARLDLHGLKAAEAAKGVRQFIDNSRHSRHRCVCIIHGRGLNSAGGVSVLKGVVHGELTRSGAVLAFASAPRSDGGSGAVYVLLRR